MTYGGSGGTKSFTATNAANAASNYGITVTAAYSGLTSKTATVNFSVFKYKVTFYDSDGSTVLRSEQTVNYNGSATPPTNPGPKTTATQHQLFEGWDTGYTNLTSGKGLFIYLSYFILLPFDFYN